MKILLIDDEEDSRLAFLRGMSDVEAFIITALDPIEGVWAVDFHRPDLVICDFDLRSEINGVQTIRTIQKHRNIPCILYTGSDPCVDLTGIEMVEKGDISLIREKIKEMLDL